MDGGDYMVLKAFSFEGPDCTVVVPRFFRTDFASIPRGLRWLVTGHGDTRKPAVIHDYLYRHGIGTKKAADNIFNTAMKEEGVPAWKRRLIYRAVSWFGGFSWRGE
jgi:hypothetical protein